MLLCAGNRSARLPAVPHAKDHDLFLILKDGIADDIAGLSEGDEEFADIPGRCSPQSRKVERFSIADTITAATRGAAGTAWSERKVLRRAISCSAAPETRTFKACWPSEQGLQTDAPSSPSSPGHRSSQHRCALRGRPAVCAHPRPALPATRVLFQPPAAQPGLPANLLRWRPSQPIALPR